MQTTNWTIKGAFGIIGEIFDELSHADSAWNACGWGESVRSRTYRQEVEKMNEKISIRNIEDGRHVKGDNL